MERPENAGDGRQQPDEQSTCRIVAADGTVLARGVFEATDSGFVLHHLSPPGAIANAFFSRGQRRFRVVFPDGSTLVVLMQDCRWQDGERMCHVVPIPGPAAA